MKQKGLYSWMVVGGSSYLGDEALGFLFVLSPPTKICSLCGWEFNRLFIYPHHSEAVRWSNGGSWRTKIAAVKLPCSEFSPNHSRWTLQSSGEVSMFPKNCAFIQNTGQTISLLEDVFEMHVFRAGSFMAEPAKTIHQPMGRFQSIFGMFSEMIPG